MIDEATKGFRDFLNQYENLEKIQYSEADTRSKLIDSLLITVLGWDEKDIQREGYISKTGYFDYIVSIPGIHFVIEAKKNTYNINLPSHHKKVSINSIYNNNREIIDQIRSYCLESSVQYGIITNGKQFVFLKAFNTDGKPWKENNCLIFGDHSDIEKRFVEFFENFSKYALLNNGGFKFDLPTKPIEYKTVVKTLIDRDKELVRNSMSARIKPLIDKIFGEIFNDGQEDDREFIVRCFVENQETRKNKNEIERLFSDDAPKLNGVIAAVNSDSLVEQLKTEISEDNTQIKGDVPKPIIIIGSKGAGKTTFINHLFKYKIHGRDIENQFTIYLDFRKFYEKENHFDPEKIAFETLNLIHEKFEDIGLHTLAVLKRIYIKEIRINDESIWSYDKENDPITYNRRLSEFLENNRANSLSHLEKLSTYLLRERRKRLLIIIDNADQFDDTIQKKIFLFAHSINRKALCGTIVSLREGYYYKWRSMPPFDAFESNVYHITAPKYADILDKRISYAIEKLEGKGYFRDATVNRDKANNDVLDFFLSLKNSLFLESNTELLEYLNYTTYPDIREGLRVFKSFLSSGHTKITEYIARERSRSIENATAQTIPMHEFVKSIGLQNKQYYNTEKSIIYNIFNPPIDSTDHFVKLYILKSLYDLVDSYGKSGRQVKSEELIEKFNNLGYKINTINSALIDLIKSNLINTEELLTDIEWSTLPDNTNFSITLKGYYYYYELIKRFHYLDLVLQDTPIFDEDSYNDIIQNFPKSNDAGKRNLAGRMACAISFIDYLRKMEQSQPNHLTLVFGRITEEIHRNVLSVDFVRIGKAPDAPSSMAL